MEASTKRGSARIALATALACAVGAHVATASAASVPLMLPSASLVAGMTACRPIPIAGNLAPAPSFSKASAILGGSLSALEAMRNQQTSATDFGPLLPAAPSPEVPRMLEPAAGMTSQARSCDVPGNVDLSFAMPRPAPQAGRGSELAADDFLGTRRIAIARTYFDEDWSRVRTERAFLARKLGHRFAETADVESRLAAVNGWVNHAIEYTEDRDLFGVADLWAGPKRTLALRKGDCEDYALLKMHLLAAAGIPMDDMYLTIARDLVRRADHAVLIIRTEHGYRMLDNATDRVLDAGRSLDYRPVLSFSGNRKWVHGYVR